MGPTYDPPPATQYYLRRCRGVMAVELACAAHHPWSVDRGLGTRWGARGQRRWPLTAPGILSHASSTAPAESVSSWGADTQNRAKTSKLLITAKHVGATGKHGFQPVKTTSLTSSTCSPDKRITCAPVFPIDRTFSWICGSHLFRLASTHGPQDLVVGRKFLRQFVARFSNSQISLGLRLSGR